MSVAETYKKQFVIDQLYAIGVKRIDGKYLEDLDYYILKRELALARHRKDERKCRTLQQSPPRI